RSRRPWRTLFESSLGVLPHGSILSLSQTGAVVYVNKGFERLTGLDATDVIGRDLGLLFGGSEDEGAILSQSLSLGQGCTVWMSMAGPGQDPADVLCLHQPVTVDSSMSREGSYSALLFFEASIVL
ncbi:unnamed protein product, partial [Choristocarpus tenellus]